MQHKQTPGYSAAFGSIQATAASQARQEIKKQFKKYRLTGSPHTHIHDELCLSINDIQTSMTGSLSTGNSKTFGVHPALQALFS
jgi:hypothetical protein